MGGTDEPNNLVKLTIKQHAQSHKKLYEKYGRWEDKLAWQGLSGQLGPKEKILEEFYKQNGMNNHKHLHTSKVKEKARRRTIEVNTGRKLKSYHIEAIRKSRLGKGQTDYQKKTVAEKLSEYFIITDPKGNTFEIKNLNKFARTTGLDQGNLTKVAQGKLHQHKGYIVRYK
jgi:hypothetical protein